MPTVHASGATRAGRSHRARDLPCQDAFALWTSPDGARVAAAVADGLGSCALSEHGSRAACDAAVASLAGEPAWDDAALVRAFEAARHAVEAAAADLRASVHDLSTTLQVAALDGDALVAGMVGDGAVVAVHGDDAQVESLLVPAEGGYANEVVPVTASGWQEHLRTANRSGVRSVLLFTDGLTRLLLAHPRGAGWQPFAPFFDAFLPRLAAAPEDGVVRDFVASDEVDRSWDDDKCLVVVTRGD